MKNLSLLAETCIENLQKIGIYTGKVSEWKVNTRAKKRWGLCSHNADGTYKIEISDRLLADDISDASAIQTIYHELLHTCKGAFSHGVEWKRLAAKVNREYGCNIKRTTTSKELGIPFSDTPPTPPKYSLKCKNCGMTINRMRKSKLVTHPEWYSCSRCYGKLERVILDN